MAVGMLDDPARAEEVVMSGAADLVAIARAFLSDPHWPLHAARSLGADVAWPDPYARAKG
jgi:2,4-dienoyl-CoA reductase-like NADH-dependent reductase (Old Yellow Enzyme family)